MCYYLFCFSVTIVSAIFMFILFLSELNFYLTKEVQPELFVDISRGQIKMKINLNLTFHNLPCACKWYFVISRIIRLTHGDHFHSAYLSIFYTSCVDPREQVSTAWSILVGWMNPGFPWPLKLCIFNPRSLFWLPYLRSWSSCWY